jgi:hypothetical protein
MNKYIYVYYIHWKSIVIRIHKMKTSYYKKNLGILKPGNISDCSKSQTVNICVYLTLTSENNGNSCRSVF